MATAKYTFSRSTLRSMLSRGRYHARKRTAIHEQRQTQRARWSRCLPTVYEEPSRKRDAEGNRKER